VRDKFLRSVTSALKKAGLEHAAEPPPPRPAWSLWHGRPVLDPDGVRIGHVTAVRSDGGSGAWLEVSADWGVLDWLLSFGAAANPTFTCHSDDVTPTDRGLVFEPVASPSATPDRP
jgi:hypothetical protein